MQWYWAPGMPGHHPGTTKILLLPIQNATLAIGKLCVSLENLRTIPSIFSGS